MSIEFQIENIFFEVENHQMLRNFSGYIIFIILTVDHLPVKV